MTKAIIFDAGGVYMVGSFTEFVNRAHKLLGIDEEFSRDEEVVSAERLNNGTIEYEEFFKNLFNVPISDEQMEQIKELWMTTWVPSEEIADIIKGLKENYIVAMLSNSDSLNTQKYIEKGWYSIFDYLILSHEVGIIKPDKEIYEIALERLGIPAEECVFIDDQEKALIPARELGMDTILFKSVDQLKNDLKSKNIKF